MGHSWLPAISHSLARNGVERGPLAFVRAKLGGRNCERTHVAFLPAGLAGNHRAAAAMRNKKHVRQAGMLRRMTVRTENFDIGGIGARFWMICMGQAVVAMQMLSRAASFASSHVLQDILNGFSRSMSARGNAALPAWMVRAAHRPPTRHCHALKRTKERLIGGSLWYIDAPALPAGFRLSLTGLAFRRALTGAVDFGRAVVSIVSPETRAARRTFVASFATMCYASRTIAHG